MLSGTGLQRLYEINFGYGMTQEDLAERRAQLQSLSPFVGEDRPAREPALRALQACQYLTENCRFSDNAAGDIYAALIQGEADSEGLALAYVELCRQLDLPCQIVYGQRDWHSRCWNIVQIGGDYYHVDVAECIRSGMESGFLQRDESMWTYYRWDISSYPPCNGSLDFEDLLPKPIRPDTTPSMEEIQ